MLPTTIRSPPSVGDFTPLEEFQSQTPESFSGGKPILHFYLVGAKASAPKSQSNNLAIFSSNAPAAESHATNGDSDPVVEREVDVFVTSE
jgi:chloride channel, nucleotide-sensitive, 1A